MNILITVAIIVTIGTLSFCLWQTIKSRNKIFSEFMKSLDKLEKRKVVVPKLNRDIIFSKAKIKYSRKGIYVMRKQITGIFDLFDTTLKPGQRVICPKTQMVYDLCEPKKKGRIAPGGFSYKIVKIPDPSIVTPVCINNVWHWKYEDAKM